MCLFLSIKLIASVCFSQDSTTNNILTTKKFNKGIYVTFKEFKENSPSIISNFNVKIDSGKFIRYRLYDNKGKKIRRVYGFSDGINIYLNAKVYDQTNYFIPILALGKIIYFEDFVGKLSAVASKSGLMMYGAIGGALAYAAGNYEAKRNPGWIIYMPDDDGNAYALSKQTLTSILKEYDKELLKRFKSEKNQSDYDTLMKYLVEFNRNSK